MTELDMVIKAVNRVRETFGSGLRNADNPMPVRATYAAAYQIMDEFREELERVRAEEML